MQDKLDQAVALHQSGKLEEAGTLYQEVMAAVPDAAVVHHNLGLVALAQGRLDEARASLERAVALDPGFVEAHGNLGNLWLNTGSPSKAESAYQRGLEANPEHPDLRYNLGRALYEQGRWDDAEAAFRDTIRVDANHALAHWNLSHVLLLQGRFGEAWPEYEWRWQCPGFTTQLPNLGNLNTFVSTKTGTASTDWSFAGKASKDGHSGHRFDPTLFGKTTMPP